MGYDGTLGGRANAVLMLMRSPESAATKLVETCRADESLGYLRSGWLQCGGAGRSFQADDLAFTLILATLDGANPATLVKEARQFAQERTSDVAEYYPIAGLQIGSEITIDATCSLVPWSSVPECEEKSSFEIVAGGIHFIRKTPDCALKFQSRNQEALLPVHSSSREDFDHWSAAATQRAELTQDVVLCAGLSIGGAVVILGSWLRGESPFLRWLPSFGHSTNAHRFDLGLRLANSESRTANADDLRQLLAGLKKFRPSDRDILRVSAGRLQKARLENRPIDRAIDLGIALETTLLHGSKERSELRYRLAIRGAMFLADSPLERERLFNLLRKFYDLRSSAVHTGVLKASSGTSVVEILDEALSIGEQITRKIALRGTFPDWEREFVFQGPGANSSR